MKALYFKGSMRFSDSSDSNLIFIFTLLYISLLYLSTLSLFSIEVEKAVTTVTNLSETIDITGVNKVTVVDFYCHLTVTTVTDLMPEAEIHHSHRLSDKWFLLLQLR